MKSRLSSVELFYLVKELKFLCNGKIDQIYSLNKKQLLINFYVTGVGKKQIFIDAEKTLYLTDHIFPKSEPNGLCMFLRKKIGNSRVRKVEMIDFERIVRFELETKEERFELVIELFNKGNIILCKGSKILVASEYNKWKDRTIKPKDEYVYPRRDINVLDLDKKKILEVFHKSNKESLVKSLAIDLGLGGVYSEEVIMKAKVDKEKLPHDVDEKEALKISDALNNMLNMKPNPQIVYYKDSIVDIVPFDMAIYSKNKCEVKESFSVALDEYFSKLPMLKQKEKLDQKLKLIEDRITDQKSRIKEYEKAEKENQQKAEKIYQNYNLIKNILAELKEISKKRSWQEIKDKLKGHKIVKDVLAKDKSIIIDV